VSDDPKDDPKDTKEQERQVAARRAVLARRTRFVAAALAGVSVAACGKSSGPDVCLKVSPPATETAPQPCLNVVSTPPIDPDAAPPMGADGGASSPSDAGVSDANAAVAPAKKDAGATPPPTVPTVCLRVAPPPPRPCLTPVRPKSEG